jgi:tRNA A-37 threonylcarbamoyl transferase component Bud32
MEVDSESTVEDCILTPEAVLSQETPEIPNKKIHARFYSLNEKFPHVNFEGDEMIFGRKKGCDVIFSLVEVSAVHCKVFRYVAMNGVTIFRMEDWSSNGCFINGRLIGKNKGSGLEHGDYLTFISPSHETKTYISYIFQINSRLYNLHYCEHQDEVFNFYSIQDKELGRGTTGVVKLAIDIQNQNHFAVKIIERSKFNHDKNSENQFDREITILKKLRHPHIISYVDIFQGAKDMYIILELGEMELFDIIVTNDGLPEEMSSRLFGELLSAVQYLHSQGIVHRDIKPENILLTKELSVKLTDFGLAKITEKAGLMTTLCGTPQYLAPEIIAFGKGNKQKIMGYDNSVDLWSLGVVLYVMIAAEVPFDASDRHQLFLLIESGTFSISSPKFHNYSKESIDLLQKLLVVDPRFRLTITQSCNHPWIAPSTSMAPPPSTPPKGGKKRPLPFAENNPHPVSKKRRLQ